MPWFLAFFLLLSPLAGADKTLEKLVKTAYLEWSAFGEPVLDLSSRQTHRYPGGKTFQIADKNPREIRIYPRLLRLGTKEDSRSIRDRIDAYWRAVPNGKKYIKRQQKIWQIAPHAGWADAWSAAFISYLLKTSDIPEKQLARGAAHADYLNHVLASKSTQWQALSLEQADIPRVGDIICADRSGRTKTFKKPTDYPIGKFQPLHCDIVVRQDLKHNRIMAIGGNVWDAVTMTVLRIEKRKNKWQLQRTEHRPWFVVLRKK